MAEDATAMWLWDAENSNEDIPAASKLLVAEPPQSVNYIKQTLTNIERNTIAELQKNAPHSSLVEYKSWLRA